MSERIEIAKEIGRDIWKGLDRQAAALILLYATLWTLAHRAVAFWCMALIAAALLIDAAFQCSAARTASREWGYALKKWRASIDDADEEVDRRIADMWFHICVYTNFLQAPHDVKRIIEGAQARYVERHMVN